MNIYEELLKAQDTGYQQLQRKLVPHIPPEDIIGVRTPAMRDIAKRAFNTPEGDEFLKQLPHRYYDENMVHFFMISLIKDYEECVAAVNEFLPYVDCWPVCDQSSPKVFKKNHGPLLGQIREWIGSSHVYTARFGIRMLMNEFLGDDFGPEYLEWVACKNGEDYYLKMMVAWYFATALAKQYDAAIVYIEERRLPPWTHAKAIQKAIESYRVSDEHKQYLRSLR